jgi:hypothetical protein
MELVLPDLLLRNYRCRESGMVLTRDLGEWIRSLGEAHRETQGAALFHLHRQSKRQFPRFPRRRFRTMRASKVADGRL